jgi:diguanylate cyclase (GGDEF)-like protein/PAS domain S-box-containing protein
MEEKDHINNMIDYLLRIIGIAGLYAITGLIGLYLIASPPGYATPIWIPSGIALGAALIWRLRILPAIFLGSLFINFFISLQHFSSHTFLLSMLTGCIIATGAVLQASIGWMMIKKWIGLNNTLNLPNDILKFALISGPVSCLVNTTWSNTILLAINIVPLSEYPLNWFTWWIGDSIGVLIFTPVILILFAQPHSYWRERIFSILLPLLLSFTGVMFLYLLVNETIPLNSMWPVLTSGLLFCGLINIILFIFHGQKNIVQIKMDEKSLALKFAEEKNLQILRAAGEGIVGLDLKGNVTFMNPAAENMLGYEEHEMLGKSFHDTIQHAYVHGENYPKNASPILETLLSNRNSYIRNEIFWRKNGNYFWVDYTCAPLIEYNKTSGAVVVFNDMTLQREIEFRLEKMAHYDALTRLPNRYSFLERLSTAIKTAEEKNQIFAVCFIDLDNFKQINDNLGHSIGDETLKHIASLLQSELSKSDYLARLGGDEFAVILENITSIDEIKLTLHRYISSLNKIIRVNDFEVATTFSMGVALYPQAGKTSNELIKNADIAMYRAKELNKNTYAFFDEEMTKKIQRHHQIDIYLRLALERNEFTLEYQPLIDSQTQEIFGIEALLRWNHPLLGSVTPAEFIPIAEQNGMIHVIGEWVLKQACRDYQDMVAILKNKSLFISVNISIQQFEKEDFLIKLKNYLKETNMKNNFLIIEITESGLMRYPEHTIKVMNDIKKLGVRFALDDFGVRYSSMEYLKDLPISLLKIDRNFVQDIMTNSNDAAIVKAIIQMSHGLGISTIVEGVENEELFQYVKSLGTEYVQGFYFSKSLPLDQLLIRLKQFSSANW